MFLCCCGTVVCLLILARMSPLAYADVLTLREAVGVCCCCNSGNKKYLTDPSSELCNSLGERVNVTPVMQRVEHCVCSA